MVNSLKKNKSDQDSLNRVTAVAISKPPSFWSIFAKSKPAPDRFPGITENDKGENKECANRKGGQTLKKTIFVLAMALASITGCENDKLEEDKNIPAIVEQEPAKDAGNPDYDAGIEDDAGKDQDATEKDILDVDYEIKVSWEGDFLERPELIDRDFPEKNPDAGQEDYDAGTPENDAGQEDPPAGCHRYVSIQGSDYNDGSENSPWKDIQYAIDTSPNECNIYIGEGRYNGQVNIDKDLQIKGEGPKKTYIVYSADVPVVRISDAEVSLMDLGISGDYGTAFSGIYIENSEVDIQNVSTYAIRYSHISLLDSNFTLKNIKLKEAEVQGYVLNSDIGIAIANSEGVIDGLENDNNIDHVVYHSVNFKKIDKNGLKEDMEVKDSKQLTVVNSTIRGRNYNWGDGINFFGHGNYVIIENNEFIGSDSEEIQFPETLEDTLYPNAIKISNGHFVIKNNNIQGYPTGIFIEGINTGVEGYDNKFEGNGVAIHTLKWGNLIADFGGGPFDSTGNNTFNSTFLDIRHLNSNTFYAENNTWKDMKIYYEDGDIIY